VLVVGVKALNQYEYVKGVPSKVAFGNKVASGIEGYVEGSLLRSEKMVRVAASSAAPSSRPWKCSAYPEAGEEDVEEARRGKERRRRGRSGSDWGVIGL